MCPPVIAAVGIIATVASTAVSMQASSAQGKAAVAQGVAQQNQINYQGLVNRQNAEYTSAMQRQQAEYQAQVAERQGKIQENAALVAANNARLVRLQGEEAAAKEQRENAVRLGAQRATLAANGVDPNVGSAFQLAEDTATQGGLSAANLQYGALLRGMSFDRDADLSLADANASRVNAGNIRASGEVTAANTLTSGTSAFQLANMAGQNAYSQGQVASQLAQGSSIGAGLSGASQFASRWDTFQKAGGFGGLGTSLGWGST